MRRALLSLIVVGIALGISAASGASTHHFRGTVIARMRAQGELVVAGANGHAMTLRAPSLPAVGTVVSASTFRLADGTTAASRLTVVGHVRHAQFRGILVRTVGRLQFFAVGHSFVVAHMTGRSHAATRMRASTRSIASARVSSQSPGEEDDVQVAITSGGELDETGVTTMEEPGAATVTLQVTISAVTAATATAPGSITLSVNGQTLTVPLPAGTTLPTGFTAGATVELTLVLSSAGTAMTTTTTTTTTPTTSTAMTTTTTTTTTPTTTTTSGPCVDNDGDFDDMGCASSMKSPCVDNNGDSDDAGCTSTVATGPCVDNDHDFDDTGCASGTGNVFGEGSFGQDGGGDTGGSFGSGSFGGSSHQGGFGDD